MSNEWLTTGQMIDRLKVGEVAELNPKYIKGIEDIAYDAVLKFRGAIVWYRKDSKKTGETIEINDEMLNFKWRILPSYVSFEEAMKALKEGKTVSLRKVGNSLGNAEYNDKITYEEADMKALSFTKLGGHGLLNLVDGKWTIEDDTP